jgi:hypothetical protein
VWPPVCIPNHRLLNKSVRLAGVGRGTTIINTPSSFAATMTIDHGSRVIVTGMTVQGGSEGALVDGGGSLTLIGSRVTAAMYNIDNSGTLALSGTLVDHAHPVLRLPAAGIVNLGIATVTSSSISLNDGIGVESLAGSVALSRSAVTNNSLFGIYAPGGTVTADAASSITGNGLRNCFEVGGTIKGGC